VNHRRKSETFSEQKRMELDWNWAGLWSI